MKKYLKVPASLCAAMLLLAGCAGTTYVPTRYFTLDIPPREAQTVPEGPTLGYRPFQAAKPYKVVAMAYRPADNELAYRANEEWADYPADVVTRVIADAIEASGAFADVGDAAVIAPPEYLLTGTLRAYHEDRTVDPPEAVLEVHLELRDRIADTALWDRVLTAREPMSDEDAATLASAMTQALTHVAAEAGKGIAGAVAQTRAFTE